MAQERKKITVVNGIDEKGEIKVEESERLETDEEHEKIVEDGVKKLYQSEQLVRLDKPNMCRTNKFGLIILAIIFGLLAGAAASFFIVTQETIKIPFYKEINLRKYFPTKEVTLVTEKKVTVTQDLRLATLVKDFNGKVVKIFVAKSLPKEGQLPFLEQIYAPWQIKSLGTIITNDGWSVSSGDFNPPTGGEKYVAVSEDNKIFPVQTIIQDPLTKIYFLKFSAENLPVIKFASLDETTPGLMVIILDKLNNLHLTSVSQPQAVSISKTDDLIHSADRYDESLKLDPRTSLSAFPNAPIFGLDGALVGLITNEKIVPAWQFKNLINQILKGQQAKRPYLGIDYLNIEEAPGLQSPLFKDLNNGAIVYGNPAKNSPAEKAEIKNADIIVKVDGLPLTAEHNLTYLVQNKNVGDTIELTILRAGEEKNIKIILGEAEL